MKKQMRSINQDMVKTVKNAILEDAKRSSEERFQVLVEAGIIDAQGRGFSENLAMVEDLLHEKGFSGVSAFHIGNVPGGAVRLHKKIGTGREAEGPYDAIRKMIDQARDHEDLWQALENAGYCGKTLASDRKKTG